MRLSPSARRGPGLPFPPLSDPAGRLNTFLENTETGRDSTTSRSFSPADLKEKIELLEHCGTLKFAEWNPRSLVSTEKLIASLRIFAAEECSVVIFPASSLPGTGLLPVQLVAGYLLYSVGRGDELQAGVTVAIRQELALTSSVYAIAHSNRFLELRVVVQGHRQHKTSLDMTILAAYAPYGDKRAGWEGWQQIEESVCLCPKRTKVLLALETSVAGLTKCVAPSGTQALLV